MPADPNPLLSDADRIPFHRIGAEHVVPGIRQALEEAQVEVDAVAAGTGTPTWDGTLGRLDDALQALGRRMAPASHLVSVRETPELREAYNEVLPELSVFFSRLPLNQALWARVRAYNDTEEAAALTGLRRRHLDKTVQEFRRAGADLPQDRKHRLETLRDELAH
jgi:oligopeptidase A